MMKGKVRVLVVDDSLVFRETLARGIAQDFGIEVVGTASDPFEARDRILQLRPDVLTLDVQMPKMDGIEFLKKLMPQYPLPVVVVSAAGGNVLDALNAGAVDFVAKPDPQKPGALSSFINELIVKIKIASTAKVGGQKSQYNASSVGSAEYAEDTVIAIGASTGGTEAVYQVVKALPRDMPGIVVVQHMPPVFTRLFAQRLNGSCALEVAEAQDGDEVKPGRVLIAPGDFQMKVYRDRGRYFVRCVKGEKVSGHCPSVDVLFRSVAESAGSRAVGVILTGMGSDGAKGLLDMRSRGACTIGQDEKTSVVYGMPMVAFETGAVERQAPLDRIPELICAALKTKCGRKESK